MDVCRVVKLSFVLCCCYDGKQIVDAIVSTYFTEKATAAILLFVGCSCLPSDLLQLLGPEITKTFLSFCEVTDACEKVSHKGKCRRRL